ncbi:hypothetical protein [Clostridium sp. UBA1056]|uniref:hypothetical protein n=1 Tax=unclassified Clostridium TaxID=2614128 RepID=UPI0032173449
MEENTVEIMESSNKEIELKTCFVITPIGDENSSIRRHIDGVINAAIIPALGDDYKIKVAHKFTSPGSINKQVIIEIYNADLVVANLTELNPNVMYELAIRHALKKPVIMIMEKESNKLPFDVATERTIFYKNDFQGVLDLKDQLIQAEEAIKDNCNLSNPIYDALENYMQDEKLIKKIESESSEDVSVLKSILLKIDSLEKSIINSNSEVAVTESYCNVSFNVDVEYLGELSREDYNKIRLNVKRRLIRKIDLNFGISASISIDDDYRLIIIRARILERIVNNSKFINDIGRIIRETINSADERIEFRGMSITSHE